MPDSPSSPAAQRESTPSRSRAHRGIAPAMLAGLLALGGLIPVGHISAPVADASCRWTSTSTPPPSIRVLRAATGRIDSVDFSYYVRAVVAYEWGSSSLPFELVRAGAQAVKQYGWYHALRQRSTSDGRCYHVTDSTSDQRFSPKYVATDRQRRAIASIWSWRVLRDGQLIMTGYRRGYDYPCAYDAGRRLYARSARKCANAGWSAGAIVKRYYTATVRT
jgi:peptidoglycan hydrolase-like amidase